MIVWYPVKEVIMAQSMRFNNKWTYSVRDPFIVYGSINPHINLQLPLFVAPSKCNDYNIKYGIISMEPSVELDFCGVSNKIDQNYLHIT